jgi:triacylglycerol lipase
MLLRKILPALVTTTVAALAALLVAPTPAVAGTPTAAVAAPEPAATTGDGRAGAATAAANPVIVVGGLVGIAAAYEPLATRLRADGHRVFVYELPNLGLGDIAASARSFSGFVADVRSRTGAAKVDLVAHSEGGLVSRYFVGRLDGAGSVGRYVSLGTPQYGTYVADIARFIGVGTCAGIVACQQMTIGSGFLADLNAGDDTPGTIRWTTIRTLQDELVRPVDNARLADGATNVLIQSYCPVRLVGHLGLVLDGTTYTVIRSALADAPVRPHCFAV